MRQIKVRVKSNDNDQVEEWWPVEQVVGSLIERINQIEGENIRLAKRIERLETSFRAVAIDTNNRIERLEDQVERMEQILAKNGSPKAIELRSQLIGEVNGQYVGEEPEPNGARFREEPCCSCPHDMFPVGGCDCECHRLAYQREHEEEPDERLFDAVNDLLYGAETNSYPRGQFNAEYLDALRKVFLLMCKERAGIPTLPNRCPRCNGLMPPGDSICVECESELAEEQATLTAADFGYEGDHRD